MLLERRLPALVPAKRVKLAIIGEDDAAGATAAQQAEALGFSDVHWLAGGFSGWVAAGLPTIDGWSVPGKDFGERILIEEDVPEIEADDLAARLAAGDRPIVLDCRTPAEFAAGTIPGAVNIQAGEAVAANDDGRLPFRDKSTRVVVFGNTAAQAKVVGAEVAKRAYWGSSYFGGTFDDLLAAGLINHPPVVLTKNAVIAAGTACTASSRPPRA